VCVVSPRSALGSIPVAGLDRVFYPPPPSLFPFHFFIFFNGRRAAERWRQTKFFLPMCRNWKHQRITSLILQGVPFKSCSHPARKDKQFCGNGGRMGGGGISRESKVFPLSISLWWWGSIVSVYWLLYRCLGQMNVLIRREKHDGRIEWAMSVWDVSSWALQCGGKVFRRTPFVMFTNKVFRANVNLSLVLRVKSTHDHEFTPNRLRSESEEKRNWISRLDHEPVVSR
jgi:hypothetical protein